jgi:RNA polymerase sigma-70 factor (sigma-E family)
MAVLATTSSNSERGDPVGTSQEADAALLTLYTDHYAELVRLATLLLWDRHLAEDTVQDAYVSVHAAWPGVRDRSAGAAYLRRTVVNGCRSRLRRLQVSRKHPEQPSGTAPSAEVGGLAGVQNAEMMAALRSLSRRQREVIVLRYYADLSEVEIAETLHIAAGSVKKYASRGLQNLRTVLQDIEVES